jgi:glutamine synthetase
MTCKKCQNTTATTIEQFIPADYVWLDQDQNIRHKVRLIPDPLNPPDWNFDGSSTGQAPTGRSDLGLFPVRAFNAGPVNRPLIICEVLDGELPHSSNTRARLEELVSRYQRHKPMIGFEQEYTLYQGNHTLAPLTRDQGPFYCSVGSDRAYGRDIVEDHMEICLEMGLPYYGYNAEVMPGQWEFQLGFRGNDEYEGDPLHVCDSLIAARFLLHQVAEDYGVEVRFDAKPEKGDWNGAGCHANFSTLLMRNDFNLDFITRTIKILERQHDLHIRNYGKGIEDRLTGKHETCHYSTFRSGVADRGSSIRIPTSVAIDGKGYIEDRRPNANCDPYTVAYYLIKTVCDAIEQPIGV